MKRSNFLNIMHMRVKKMTKKREKQKEREIFFLFIFFCDTTFEFFVDLKRKLQIR